MTLFPGGGLAGKAIWIATCGVAMGVLIGATSAIAGSLFYGWWLYGRGKGVSHAR